MLTVDWNRPQSLWLLVILPLLVAFERVFRRIRQRDWALLGRNGSPPAERTWPRILALGLLIAAVGGPRWGQTAGSALPPGHDVILLVDVSRSMAAEDAVPNRLKAATAAAESLVAELARSDGDRVGVVAFAGRGVLKCPLTENLGAVLDALKNLRPGEIPPGGTNLAAGLAEAVDAFDDQEASDGRTIVVFSDGEDFEGTWQNMLGTIRQRKIHVHGVALGDAARGQMVPVKTPEGRVAELQFQGQTVFSHREDLPLQTLSQATGGVFVPMGTKRANLGQLYRLQIAPSAKRTRETQRLPDRVEHYTSFVISALLLLASTYWPSSRRAGLLLVLFTINLGAGPNGQTASQRIAEGNRLFAGRNFEQAAREFELASQLDRTSPIPLYNAAAALYQMGKYADAETAYLAARQKADAALRVKIDYALGNVAVAQRHYKKALDHYDGCLGSKVASPGLAEIRRDAAINRAFAARLVPPPTSPDESGDRQSPSQPKNDPAQNSPEASPKTKSDRSQTSQNPASGKPDGKGAAATNPSPPESPRAQLDSMLDDVRKAQETPVEGVPPTSSSSGNRKDW